MSNTPGGLQARDEFRAGKPQSLGQEVARTGLPCRLRLAAAGFDPDVVLDALDATLVVRELLGRFTIDGAGKGYFTIRHGNFDHAGIQTGIQKRVLGHAVADIFSDAAAGPRVAFGGSLPARDLPANCARPARYSRDAAELPGLGDGFARLACTPPGQDMGVAPRGFEYPGDRVLSLSSPTERRGRKGRPQEPSLLSLGLTPREESQLVLQPLPTGGISPPPVILPLHQGR